MDSELTLVSFVPPTPYYLSSTDLTDAVIFARPGVPLYRITNDAKHLKICEGATPNRIIATIHRRGLLSDTISFPQRHENGGTDTGTGTQMNLHRWLKRSKAPNGMPMFTIDTEYGPHVWKMDSRHRHKIFADYDLENPVASCFLYQSLPTGKPAFILESIGEPLRDDIVVSYIIQRQRLWMENMTVGLLVGPN